MPSSAHTLRDKNLVLYDGDCAFCKRQAEWVLKNDKNGVFEIAPYQEADVSPELRKACERAMHIITKDGRILKGGSASTFILAETKGKFANILNYPPLSWLTELGYRFVAHIRRHL